MKNYQNQLSHPGLSHTEQECQDSLIQGKIRNQQNSNEGLEYRAYFRIQGKVRYVWKGHPTLAT